MEETTYDDGRKVVRLGPLAEMQQAAIRDLAKGNVLRTCITKVPSDVVEKAVAKVMEDLERLKETNA